MMIIKLKLLKITKESRLFVLPIYMQKETKKTSLINLTLLI